MPILVQWDFSLLDEHLKLVNSLTGEVIYFPRRSLSFYPVAGTDELILNGQSTNIIKKINRFECNTPPPGPSMLDFLDSLATLASI